MHALLLLSLTLLASSSSLDSPVFPLNSAVFLPLANLTSDGTEHHLATIESVRPIVDIAMVDAYYMYLQGWAPSADSWLHIHEAPIEGCDDQTVAAWSVLEAHRWTNGSGLDVAFGPACDYVLATIGRILSFYNVPMFTNAGFSEYFNRKGKFPLTRVGPLQDHITMMFNQLATRFDWRRPQLLYEKTFWESELREAGFCKLLMTGMYVWTVEKKWTLHVNPRIVPSMEDADPKRGFFRDYLKDTIGVNYGGKLAS